MGARGPVPKLKLLAGATNQRRRGTAFPAGTPNAPEWLSSLAKAEWRRIVPELEAAGLLSRVDRAALAVYCQTWAEYTEATKILKEDGTIIEEPIQSAAGEIIGHKKKPHPAVKLQRDASTRIRQFMSEFGFSPGTRGRVGSGQSGSTEAETPDNPLGKIVGRIKKARQAAG